MENLVLVLRSLVAVSFLGIWISLGFLGKTGEQEMSPLQAPPQVLQILKRSCYDCHSEKPEWPLYAYIFPVSLYLENHVQEGRNELNFSQWGEYSPTKQKKLLDSVFEEIDEGEMPLPPYLLMHPEKALSSEEKEILKQWIYGKEE